MHEHDQPRRGVGERRAHRARVKRYGLAVHPHRGRLVKVATRALEPITNQAIQRSDHGATATRRRERNVLPDPPLLHGHIDGPSQQRRASPDPVVGAARQRVVDHLHRAARRTHTPERTARRYPSACPECRPETPASSSNTSVLSARSSFGRRTPDPESSPSPVPVESVPSTSFLLQLDVDRRETTPRPGRSHA